MKCCYCGKKMSGDKFEDCESNPSGFCIPDGLFDVQKRVEMRGEYR